MAIAVAVRLEQLMSKSGLSDSDGLELLQHLRDGREPRLVKTQDGISLVHYGCQNGWIDFVKFSIKEHNCDPHANTKAEQTPLHFACQYGHFDIVRYLISEQHCDPDSCDSNQQTPLHILCGQYRKCTEDQALKIMSFLIFSSECDVNKRDNHGNTGLLLACRNQSVKIVRFLEANCDVTLRNHDGNTALHIACRRNITDEISKLLLEEAKMDPNAKNNTGDTPLHTACRNERSKQVQLLVRDERCNPNEKDSNGDTALHVSCRLNKTVMFSRLLLEEAMIDANAKNNDGLTPLDLTSNPDVIRALIRHGANPQDVYKTHGKVLGKRYSKHPLKTPVKLFMVGNPSAGKSTLAKALQKEAFGLKRIAKRIVKVSGVDEKTAGIVPHGFESKTYGRVTLYDFAGQREFYGSHAALLQNAIQTSTPIILLVVDLSANIDDIKSNIFFWLSFLENQCSSVSSKPHFLVIGSHVDVLKSRGEDPKHTASFFTSLLTTPRFASLEFTGFIALDCQYADSAGMSQLHHSLKTSCDSLRSQENIKFNAHCFLVYLLDKFREATALTLATIQAQIKEDFEQTEESAESITSYLPLNIHSLYAICNQLNDTGHLLVLKNPHDIEDSWVIINQTALLNEVNGTIFAPMGFRQHTKIASSTGVVPLSNIANYFPKHNLTMLVELLSRFEFCHEISDTEILGLIGQYQSVQGERYFFFPGLVTLEVPSTAWEPQPQFDYHCGWMLQCSRPEQFFGPRFVQVLLLRLAFSFSFNELPSTDIPSLQRKCCIWTNGIYWGDINGIETLVEIAELNRVVVLMRCPEVSSECLQLRSLLIQKVLAVTLEFCSKVSTVELFIQPSDAIHYPLKPILQLSLISSRVIALCLVENLPEIVDRSGNSVSFVSVLPFEPYAYLNKAILYSLFNEESPKYKTKVSSQLLSELAECIPKEVLNLIFRPCHYRLAEQISDPSFINKEQEMIAMWKNESEGTYQCLRQKFDQFSVFAGRNVLEIAEPEHTGKNVCVDHFFKVLEKFAKEWKSIGRFLSVPVSKLVEIEMRIGPEEECLTAVLRYWASVDPYASQRRIVWVLHNITMNIYAKSDPALEELEDLSLTLDAALSVIKKSKKKWWYIMGWLDVPHFVSELIITTYPTVDEQQEKAVEYWLRAVADASWPTLAGALYRFQEAEALQAIKDVAKSDFIPSLKNLKALLGSLTDWCELGRWLDMPDSKLDTIKISDSNRMELMLTEWHQSHPAPSWQLVARALYKRKELREHNILKDLKYNAGIHLEKGYVKVQLLKVAMTGAGGAGKTSTVRILLDEPPLPKYSSTDAVTKAQCRACIRDAATITKGAVKGKREWVNQKELLNQVLSHAKVFSSEEKQSEQQIDENPLTTSDPQVPVSPPQKAKIVLREKHSFGDILSPPPPIKPSSHSLTVERKSQTRGVSPESIAQDILLQASGFTIGSDNTTEPLAEFDILHFIDSGGQLQFHEILQVFVEELNASMFVYDATKQQHSKIVDQFVVEGEKVGDSYQSHYNHEQLLKRTLQALQQHHNSKLAIVATHRDQMRTNELSSSTKWIRELVRESSFQNCVLENDPRDLVFYLDASRRSDEDVKTAKLLFKVLSDMFDSGDVTTLLIPIGHFLLEQAMRKLGDYRRGIVTLDECSLMAAILNKDLPINATLAFLRKRNLILHYPQVLNNIVFCEFQTLLTIITKIVQCSVVLRGDCDIVYMRDIGFNLTKPTELQEFRNNGTITEGLLKEEPFYSKCFEDIEDVFSPADFLALMEHLQILGRISYRPLKHIMPCVLREMAKSELRKCRAPNSAEVESLLLYFGKWPQSGVFCSLIAGLVSKYHWIPRPFQHQEPKCLYRNCIRFEIRTDPLQKCFVTLIESYNSGYFELHIELPKGQPLNCYKILCPKVREVVIEELANSRISSPIVDAFFCHDDGCKYANIHAAVLENHQYLVCSRTSSSTYINVDDSKRFSVWFKKSSESKHSAVADLGGDGLDGQFDSSYAQVVSPEDVPQLLQLLKELAGSWQLFLGQLGVQKWEVDEIQLARAGFPNSPKLCMSDGLHYWVNSSKSPSYRVLIETLRGEAMHVPLAKSIEKFARQHSKTEASTVATSLHGELVHVQLTKDSDQFTREHYETKASTVATTKFLKLKNAFDAVADISGKWRQLGIQLEVETLDDIRAQCSNDNDCLEKVLRAWLDGEEPLPSWEGLVEALGSRSVGEEGLAEEVKEKYCLKRPA